MSGEALTSTFTEMRKGFLKLASKFLPNEEDANDALQEAFCRLWPKRETIRNRSEAEALTVTTVKNLCIDTLRKQHLVTVEIDSERDGEIAECAQDRMEREEQFKEVEKIINRRLTPIQQKIIKMREFDDLSFDIIASELEIQETAVRMQLSRARKIIRECYRNSISL